MRCHALTLELIRNSGEKARNYGHSVVGTVHVLLALMEQPGFEGKLLRFLGAGPELVDAVVQLVCGCGTPGLPLPQGFTGNARMLFFRAGREARCAGCRQVQPAHVLLALARMENTQAGRTRRRLQRNSWSNSART